MSIHSEAEKPNDNNPNKNVAEAVEDQMDLKVLSDLNISQMELHSCIQTLNKLHSETGLESLSLSSFRGLRKSLHPLFVKISQSYTTDDLASLLYGRRKSKKNAIKEYRRNQNRSDQIKLDNCELKSKRQKTLNQIILNQNESEEDKDDEIDEYDNHQLEPQEQEIHSEKDNNENNENEIECKGEDKVKPGPGPGSEVKNSKAKSKSGENKILRIPDGRVIDSTQETKDSSIKITVVDENDNDNDNDKDKDFISKPNPIESEPSIRHLRTPQSCYICKSNFTLLHHFYHALCPSCASFNFIKRNQSIPLTGYYALVTGGRLKIGFETVLKLLRSGAFVICTTRFPIDCIKRLSKENDFNNWQDRVHVYGLDFRQIQKVHLFCQFMYDNYPQLDILINNACQTVRRPPIFYEHLLEAERTPFLSLPKPAQEIIKRNLQIQKLSGSLPQNHLQHSEQKHLESSVTHSESLDSDLLSSGESESILVLNKNVSSNHTLLSSSESSQMIVVEGDELRDRTLFPLNAFDSNGQQVDLRPMNSWKMKLADVHTNEVAECLAINSLVPYVLISKLRKLMEKRTNFYKFIVNVSSMEGKFSRRKAEDHPHTNMAKAALNMITRTSGRDYSRSHIYMTSVDTGWINDERPLETAYRLHETKGFQTPLDEIDAAARIMDPIIDGILKEREMKSLNIYFKEEQNNLNQNNQNYQNNDIHSNQTQNTNNNDNDDIINDSNLHRRKLKKFNVPRKYVPLHGVFLKDYQLTEW